MGLEVMEGIHVDITYTQVTEVVEELKSLSSGIYLAGAGSNSCLKLSHSACIGSEVASIRRVHVNNPITGNDKGSRIQKCWFFRVARRAYAVRLGDVVAELEGKAY